MAHGDDEPRRDGALPMNARLEHFSLAFVRMVAAVAGCSIKSHETDYDGVDMTIASSAEYDVYYCPEFELQLKCTSQTHIVRDDHVAWRMAAKPLAKLASPKRFNPACLGVLLIPDVEDEWLELNEERLMTKSRMYWQHARLLDQNGHDDQATKTVHLPRRNLFDVPHLLEIMKEIGEGGCR